MLYSHRHKGIIDPGKKQNEEGGKGSEHFNPFVGNTHKLSETASTAITAPKTGEKANHP